MLFAGYRKFLSLTLPPISPGTRLQFFATAALITAVAFLLAWLPVTRAIMLTGGTLFLVLALLQPTLILLALIPMVPFSSLFTVPIGGAKAGAMELLLLLGVAVWLLKLLTAQVVRSKPLTVTNGPMLAPFVILLIGVMASWLNALSIRASLVETIKWAEMLALYLLVINLLPPKHIKWAVAVILLTGMAQATLGIYQFVFKIGPDGFLLFDGQFLRAYGTFAQPNPYAGYLGLVLPLALSLAIWAIESGGRARAVIWSTGSPDYLNKLMGLASFAGRVALLSLPLLVLLAALFASQSRGAWVGFAAGSLVTIAVRGKKYAAVLTASALIMLLALLARSIDFGPAQTDTNSPIAAVAQRFVAVGMAFEITDVATTPVTDANFATVERLAHWQAARDMWRDNPWLGVGFGNYAVVYPAYAVGRWLDSLGHAHNYLLNLGAETGLVGVVAYGIFWICAFGVSLLAVRQSRGFEKAVAAGGIGILTHLQVHNMVDNLYVQGMYLHVAIILGLISVVFLCHKRV